MRDSLPLLALLASSPLAAVANAAPPAPPANLTAVAVLDIAAKGGISAEQAEALTDLVANLIRGIGVARVIGMADIRATLQLEQERQLLGCTERNCLADLGGALGVPWVVTGNVSRFGESWVVNLSLIDARAVEVTRGVTRAVRGGEEALVAALPDAVRELVTGVAGLREEGGILFLRRRAGLIPISLALGVSATIPPHRSNEDVAPSDYDQLSPLNEVYAAGQARLFAGYAFADWLTVGPRLLFSAGGDVKRRRRAVASLDVGLEVQGILPLNHRISPLFMLGGGLGKAWDVELNGNGANYDGTIFRLEIGFGGELRLAERWFISGLVVATETVFFDIHDRGERRLGSQMYGTSINLLGALGYEL